MTASAKTDPTAIIAVCEVAAVTADVIGSTGCAEGEEDVLTVNELDDALVLREGSDVSEFDVDRGYVVVRWLVVVAGAGGLVVLGGAEEGSSDVGGGGGISDEEERVVAVVVSGAREDAVKLEAVVGICEVDILNLINILFFEPCKFRLCKKPVQTVDNPTYGQTSEIYSTKMKNKRRTLHAMLLFALIATTSALKDTNITLGFVSSYCAIDHQIFNSSLVTNFSEPLSPWISYMRLSGFIYYNDIAMLLAVQEVNSSPTILPDVHVNVKRFTDCGPWYPNAENLYNGNSEGYATAVMASDINDVHKDVIGLISNQWSTTANGPAEIMSYTQIPYCAAQSTSPRFSDKNKYPYFWRTVPSLGLGEHIVQLLKSWNVNRVSMVVQADDDMSYRFGVDISKTLLKHRFNMLTVVNIHTDLDSATVQDATLSLKRADARYIIVSGQTNFVAGVIYALGKQGLFGPNIVWITYMTPQPGGDPLEMFGADFYKYMEGIIFLLPLPADNSNPKFKKEYLRIQEATSTNMTISDFQVYFIIQAAYDCAMMMLLGFDKLLKENKKSFTPKMLAERKLQRHMNYTLFQDLGYDGVTLKGMRLTDGGDLALPYQFQYFTGKLFETVAFGQTNIKATAFTSYAGVQPKFSGGSSTPPADGATQLVEQFYSSDSLAMGVLIALAIIGILVALGFFGFVCLNRDHKVVKSMSIPESLFIVIGSLLCYIHMLLFLGAPSREVCVARVWTLSLGFIFAISGLVCKNVYIARIFWSRVRHPSRLQLTVRSLNAVIVLVELILLAVWTKDYQFQTLQIVSDNKTRKTCGHLNSVSSSFCYNVAIFLCLIPTIYLVQKVSMPNFNETYSLVYTLLIVGISVGITLISKTNIYTDLVQGVLTWVSATSVLTLVIGSRILEVYLDPAKPPKVKSTRENQTFSSIRSQQQPSSARQDSKAATGRESVTAAMKESSGTVEESVKTKPSTRDGFLQFHGASNRPKSSILQSTAGVKKDEKSTKTDHYKFHIFSKAQRLIPCKTSATSSWNLARVELHDLRDGELSWIALNFQSSVLNCIISRGAVYVAVQDSFVFIRMNKTLTKKSKKKGAGKEANRSTRVKFTLQFEFADKDTAIVFATEVQETLASMSKKEES
ncbi:Gamma-aminobutyric acid type B receptor subunit 2 [Chytriomyces hyalinus]|nr:Gamma-aminobutyric acid type B receptor subunit 2 [Chytriomyces hyalinus]